MRGVTPLHEDPRCVVVPDKYPKVRRSNAGLLANTSRFATGAFDCTTQARTVVKDSLDLLADPSDSIP
jgi:hypothetical protein